jgi:hypothetical protein
MTKLVLFCLFQSSALSVLMESLQNMEGIKGNTYYIDSKVVSKEKLYGTLDGTTLEWADGIFTSIVRKILDNQTGESERRHCIVFDGDVDPGTFLHLRDYQSGPVAFSCCHSNLSTPCYTFFHGRHSLFFV